MNNIGGSNGFTYADFSKNGCLLDALEVDFTNPEADINKPRILNSTDTTENFPSDHLLVWGLREVFWYSSDKIILKIIGMADYGKMVQISNLYNGSKWIGWNNDGADVEYITQSGNQSLGSRSGGAKFNITVTFEKQFLNIPTITCTPYPAGDLYNTNRTVTNHNVIFEFTCGWPSYDPAKNCSFSWTAYGAVEVE